MVRKIKPTKEQIYNAKIIKLTLDFNSVASDVQKQVRSNGEEITIEEAIRRTYDLIMVAGKFNK